MLLYETAAFHSGFAAQDPNEFTQRFYQIYSKAMGVIDMERKELKVDYEEVELGDEDYEGENEDIMRVNPGEMRIDADEDDE